MALQTLPLSDHHAAMLAASAITADVMAERGYQSLEGDEGYKILRAHGFTTGQSANLPGLLLPVWGTDGSQPLMVYRPDTPRLTDKQTPRKYELPRGRTMRLDVPPRCHAAIAGLTPLWITEGQKKGDALTSAGACALVLLGVDCWRGKNPHGGTTAMADWEHVAIKDRHVRIVFDSDIATKPPIRVAAQRLANFLKAKGALVSLCLLPPAEGGKKQGIDDWLAAGHTLTEAEALCADPWEGQPSPQQSAATENKRHLPKIYLDQGQIEVTAKEAQDAIMDWQARHGPQLFQRAGVLCFVTRDLASQRWLQRPPMLPQAQIAPLSKIRGLCSLVATWWQYDKRASGWQQTAPPLHLVQMLMDHGEWPLPPLKRIATRPFLRRDHTLCQDPGYDALSGVLLEGERGTLTVPAGDALDLFAATAAWDQLRALWSDFPFATERDEAATLAALLTLVARPAIDGACPLFAVVSSTPGSGKGLLVDLLCLIATGDIASRWVLAREMEEARKQLMTIAIAGEQAVLLDNIEGELGNAALDMALTSSRVSDRLLGTQTTVHAPFNTVLFATGNNIGYRSDTFRRVVQITLQPQQEHPEHRTDFVHPQIRTHTRQHESTYLQAVCTILLAYIADGSPPPPDGMGSFEEWNALIRGCVLWTTGVDLIEGQEKQLGLDPEMEGWRQVVTLWYACLGEMRRTISQVKNEIEDMLRDDRRGERDHVTVQKWMQFRDALAALDFRGDGTRLNIRAIAKTFSLRKGRIINGMRVVKAGQVDEVVLWMVQKVR